MSLCTTTLELSIVPTRHGYLCALELLLSGLIRAARQPDMQKTRIIGFFFENRLHWQFACYYLQYIPRLNLSTTPDLKCYKP